MDFADFDLRAASERGSWVHLKAPRDGKTGDGVEFKAGDPLYADQAKKEGASRVLLKGFADKEVMETFTRSERIQMLLRHRLDKASSDEADAIITQYQADLNAAMDDLIACAVSGIQNFTVNGKLMDVNRETVLRFFGHGSAFYVQVHAAIVDQQRLFTSADSA